MPTQPAARPYAHHIAPAADARRAPRRGRPPSLTEAQIAEAALVLSDRVRFDNLSMRGLAAELGVPVMTLYGHVPNKRALFDLMADHLLRPIHVPPPDAGEWDVRMRLLQTEARAVVSRHPGLRLINGVGQSKEAARLADGVMSILSDGGFTPDAAELAFTTLFTFMLGQVELDAMANSLADAGDGPGPVNSSPTKRDELFEFAFDVMLEGLRARLRPGRRR